MSDTPNKARTIKKGETVKLLVGSRDSRGKDFIVTAVKDDRIFLDGYRALRRSKKINQQNTDNYVLVPHSVHVSNVSKV